VCDCTNIFCRLLVPKLFTLFWKDQVTTFQMQLCNHKWYSFYYKINTHTHAMFLILPANGELSLRLQINFSTFVKISWCAPFEDMCDHTKMSCRVFVLNFFTVFWKDQVTTFQMQLCNHKWYIFYYKINTHTHAMFCGTYLILAPNSELCFLLQISFSTRWLLSLLQECCRMERGFLPCWSCFPFLC